MYDDLPPVPKPVRSNAGFEVGFVGGIILALMNLTVFLINGGDTIGDGVVWFLQVGMYFFLGQIAAHRQLARNLHTYEPLRGVEGAAVGAPLVTSLVMWLYIIIRGVVRDALGIFIFVEPFSLCAWIFIDVLLAIGLGSAAGHRVLRAYRHHDQYY